MKWGRIQIAYPVSCIFIPNGQQRVLFNTKNEKNMYEISPTRISLTRAAFLVFSTNGFWLPEQLNKSLLRLGLYLTRGYMYYTGIDGR